MFNVDITGTFHGVFPSNISVSARNHSGAIRHYKSALRARQVTASGGSSSSGSRGIVLESAYGFQFRVDARSSSSSASSRVRLSLPARTNRQAVARALGGANGRPQVHRSGIVVKDPYGVTWVIA